MPRKPRLHVPGGFYHVTLRGNHRQPIFACEADRAALDEMVADVTADLSASVHAYCWMTNHLHALVQVTEAPLARVMQRLATRYARYFQREMGTTGHLFERRYHAVLVASDSQLLTVARYIHLNPVRAGLVTDPADYPWSGHRGYLGLPCPAWLHRKFILGMLNASPAQAESAYAAFVAAAELPEGDISGLPARPASASAMELHEQPSRADAPGRETLDQLIARICAEERVSEAALRDRSRNRRHSNIRTRIATEARQSGVCSLSDVARRFDRHVASLSKAISRSYHL